MVYGTGNGTCAAWELGVASSNSHRYHHHHHPSAHYTPPLQASRTRTICCRRATRLTRSTSMATTISPSRERATRAPGCTRFAPPPRPLSSLFAPLSALRSPLSPRLALPRLPLVEAAPSLGPSLTIRSRRAHCRPPFSLSRHPLLSFVASQLSDLEVASLEAKRSPYEHKITLDANSALADRRTSLASRSKRGIKWHALQHVDRVVSADTKRIGEIHKKSGMHPLGASGGVVGS